METEEEEREKKPLDLDWGALFEEKGNGAPPEVVVVPNEELNQQAMEHVLGFTDHQLHEKIARLTSNISIASKLPDKGFKLRKSLKLYEEELERRKQSRQSKDSECEKSKQSRSSCSPGTCNGFSSETASEHPKQSKFTKSFSKTLENKANSSTKVSLNKSYKATLGSGHNYQNNKSNGIGNKGGGETKASSRHMSLQLSRNMLDGKEIKSPVGSRNSIDSSSFYHSCQDGKTSCQSSKKRKASPVRASRRLRTKGCETVVLLDEEDCEQMETVYSEEESIEWKDAKIYYPSRNDPECVELQYSDVKCLGPQVYLSSPVMNFYIQYLQKPASAIGESRSDYYFFNTYFYGKIKEAVSGQGKDTDTSFSKFRRWWKGVNIFEKAYILLPIHEHYHWSLIIICLPNKEDDSGPIILHLDSLGFHASGGIFRNVKRFLIKEWTYLCKTNVSPDLPIADKIWKNLDRRIDDKTITVPQQKNDYDCGIFVLFFMERFIQEAPKRLRRKDLDMFGRQWFKPEEASRLRGRIRTLLEKEFKNAMLEHKSKEPSPGEDSSGRAVELMDG